MANGEVKPLRVLLHRANVTLSSARVTPMKKLPFCVYVLKSQQDGLLYIGFTTDLHRRLTEHIHGQSEATAPRRPFDLIFCEFHTSKADALRREGYFKTTAGKKALKLMLRESLSTGLPRNERRLRRRSISGTPIIAL